MDFWWQSSQATRCWFLSLVFWDSHRVLTWFLFSTGIFSSGVIWPPPQGAFSWFPIPCPTYPPALESKRIPSSSFSTVQWDDLWLLCFKSARSHSSKRLWDPPRRHRGDIYSGSCWNLRHDLQEMIPGGHVAQLMLLPSLHSTGHKNVKGSAKRNITKCKIRPLPLVKQGLHWQAQEPTHPPGPATKLSMSSTKLKEQGSCDFRVSLWRLFTFSPLMGLGIEKCKNFKCISKKNQHFQPVSKWHHSEFNSPLWTGKISNAQKHCYAYNICKITNKSYYFNLNGKNLPVIYRLDKADEFWIL